MSVKISVIVPVYNAGKYLRECIESIVSQTFEDFEVLLIDDGSTDGSGNICDEYAKEEQRITSIHQHNQGVSIARNLGLSKAIGEWVTFVDADDYLMSNALSCLYGVAVKNNADYVFGNTIRKSETIEKLYVPKLVNKVWKNDYAQLVHFGLWGHLFRSSVIANNHIRFVEGLAYGEDMLFKYKLLAHVNTIASVSQPIYIYRANPGSVTKSSNIVRMAHHQLIATKDLIDFANSSKNAKLRKTLKKVTKLSIRQVYCNIAHASKKNDRDSVIKDLYLILGSTVRTKINLYYYTSILRIRRFLKNILLNCRL